MELKGKKGVRDGDGDGDGEKHCYLVVGRIGGLFLLFFNVVG